MDELKKLLLAAIGGATLTYEKAEESIDQFVAKGKITVDEGKILAEDLRRKAFGEEKNSFANTEQLQEAMAGMNVAQLKDIKELEARIVALEAEVDALKANQ